MQPYKLSESNGENSLWFYDDLAENVDLLLNAAQEHCAVLLTDYYRYLSEIEKGKTLEDALADLLIFGVLQNLYSNKHVSMLVMKRQVLELLFHVRSYSAKFKRSSDNLRGKLAYIWLATDKHSTARHTNQFINWLRATCEYKEEVKRLQLVQACLSKKKNKTENYLDNLQILVQKFSEISRNKLGIYTTGVQVFRKEALETYKEREDYFLATRQELEYHLNMTCAELLNRSLSKQYLNTDKRILLLPTCMAKSTHCRCTKDGGFLSCSHCTPDCQISILSKKHQSANRRVILIKHSTGFLKSLECWSNQSEVGVIGVSCVLNLLMGGYALIRMNIPSQCIFLNSCSCQKHWHTKGVPTAINHKKVAEFMQEP